MPSSALNANFPSAGMYTLSKPSGYGTLLIITSHLLFDDTVALLNAIHVSSFCDSRALNK